MLGLSPCELSLLQTQITIAVGYSLVAATGIGLTFFAGPKIISTGMRQGLSQELIEVKEGIELGEELPPPYLSCSPD